jgi:hypothetical protein
MSMTSGARRSSFSMREGRVLTGMSLPERHCLHSMTRSDCGLGAAKERDAGGLFVIAQRMRLRLAMIDRAGQHLPLQAPQAPSLQP